MKIEDAISEVLLSVLKQNHSQDYTFEAFENDSVEIYAFSRVKENEKYSIIRIGVQNEFKQIYIPNIYMPPLLKHQKVGKKLIHIIYEVGQIYDYDVFVVQLTDSFRERLLQRGAIQTNEFDTLQIVETTNLIE